MERAAARDARAPRLPVERLVKLRMWRRRGTARGGWTLIDALVSMLFLSILAAVLHSFALLSIDAVQSRQIADDLDETARIAIDFIGRDVREAGYGLHDAADRGLLRAERDEIRIGRDLDLDGALASANERVGYELDEETAQLKRQLGDAPPQPMVDRVIYGESRFRYFDADDLEQTPAELRDAAARGRVRRVEIEISLANHDPRGLGRRPVARHQAIATLRNRSR